MPDKKIYCPVCTHRLFDIDTTRTGRIDIQVKCNSCKSLIRIYNPINAEVDTRRASRTFTPQETK